MSLIKTWAPYFQSNVRMRGRAYQMAGRVKRLPAEPGELVRADVRGSQVYRVTIRGQGSSAAVACTCPVFAAGTYCKHIWATIVDVQCNPAGTTDAGASPEAQELIDQANPQPPKARRRGEALRQPRRGEPEWVGRLALLRVPVAPLDAAIPAVLPTTRQICYAISAELSTRHASLVVLLRQRDATPSGWGRLKRLRLTEAGIADLVDPVDRELCALLVGAAPIDPDTPVTMSTGQPMHDAFRMPRGAWRPLLSRVALTGRCFLDTAGDPQALTWDPGEPWVLWMVGRESDDGLEAGVELRRGRQTLRIEEPALVLGGPDGILIHGETVAPFDDRGAARWVTQFREDLAAGRAGGPIRVPAADVPRFLDRLYMLPQLPEIDLPEGVGVAEYHIQPVPQLEIFSPNAQDPLLSAGVPRTQVVARVGFAYDRYRVKPGQPGRFVGTAQPRGADSEGEARISETSPIRRDSRREQEALATLAELGFRNHPNNGADTLLLPVKHVMKAVARLLERGWVVTADQRTIRNPSPARLWVASGIDWFELHGTVKFETANGSEEVALPDLLAAVSAGKSMITLGDGSEGLLPQEWLQQHGLLTAIGKVHEDHLRFKQNQAAILDALLDEHEITSVDERFEQARQRLRRFEGIRPLTPAPTFQGTLRPYQAEGLGWMEFLRWFGMGGILADDMGLGKTIQVLAMLDERYGKQGAGAAEELSISGLPIANLQNPGAPGANRQSQPEGAAENTENAENAEDADAATAVGEPEVVESDKLEIKNDKLEIPHRPTLIVVPRSVIFNWIDEARHFAPRLRVQAYTGAERETLRDGFGDHDVIVTSYGLMRRDITELRKHPFDYVVLDEAQAIKNPASQSARAARLLEAQHRLALTGTPVENHLGDLWSIFEFLNPGLLGSGTGFGRLVRGENDDAPAPVPGSVDAAPPSSTLDADHALQVARALRPFILRRTKQQVLQELPEKTEQTILCELEPEQRALYDQLRQHYRSALLGSGAGAGNGNGSGTGRGGGSGSSSGGGGPTMMVLEALLRLRQAACHPGLIDPARADEPSVKLDTLMDRLSDLMDEGHKALVFSQFTSLLALVRRRLDERRFSYAYLDGQTRHRRTVVQRFQTDPACPLFLISLKAGGLGLNLTAAEYVFILDPWWNPAVEAQAIDRTHRIGQTRHVFAYRLICRDTVEQRIAELQSKKKKLADAIVGGQENLLRSLTREDLDQLLS